MEVDAVAGAPGSTLVDRAPDRLAVAQADVVLVFAAASAVEQRDQRVFGGRVQAVVAAVRRALPRAEIVLVSPVAADAGGVAPQRQVLEQVAARFGAFYADPAGAGYLAGRPDLLGTDGSLTAQGARQVAQRLAADLRRVLPTPLVS